MYWIQGIISTIIRLLTLLVLADAVASYILSPYHPVRSFLDRLVNPLLAPIRRFVPPIQSIDFSPLILLLVIQLLGTILVNLIQMFL